MGASRRFYREHHDAPLRTAVTLDPDVEQFLRYATQRTGLTFKSALNDALRRGLASHSGVYLSSPVPNHVETVCRLLASAGSGGNLVTDAQIGALALEYDATVHTADTDFGRLLGISRKNPLRR